MTAVGFAYPASAAALAELEGLFAEVDYLALTPETLCVPTDGDFAPNDFWRHACALQQTHGLAAVGHATSLSPGGLDPADDARRARALRRNAEALRAFGVDWYTDHLAVTAPGGEWAAQPLAVPACHHTVDRVREVLQAMQDVCPDVGVEHTWWPFLLGPWHDDVALLANVVADDAWWILDVHNLYAHARNDGFGVADWLDRAPLHRVIEIHVAGGEDAPAQWVERPYRLDSHDQPVEPAVFELLATVLPRCPNLRGVTLERREDTVRPGDGARLRGELQRIREIVEHAPAATTSARSRQTLPAGDRDVLVRREQAIIDALRTDPRRAAPQDPDGARVAARLIEKERFGRLLLGSPSASVWFDRDPASFAEAFGAYHVATPLRAFTPADEARSFHAWARDGNDSGTSSRPLRRPS
ncbi:MAG: DUF692 family multinuclear iron-containing protein [Myxococcota bacterium]